MDFTPPSDAVETQAPSQAGGSFVPPSDAVETAPQPQAGGGRGFVNPPQGGPTTAFKETLANAINTSSGAMVGSGGGEGILSAASEMLGFGGYVAGGLTGLIGEALGMPKGYAADLAERSSKNLTIQPKTEEGKATREALMYPFEKISEFGQAAGQGTVDEMLKANDQAIRHTKQFGAPKWFTGTKEEYITRLEEDQKKIEEAAPVAGAVVENTLGMTLPIVGGKAVGKVIGKVDDVADAAKTLKGEKAPQEAFPPMDKSATPEEKAKLVQQIKEGVEKRNQSSPLVETAIRNKETGEIERMGPKHEEARKAETKDTHEQGFMTERGQFLNRKEALEQAKRTKQIPEDHTLDFPEEGLHSGDLRRAGNKSFEVKEEEKIPVGETTEGMPTDKPQEKPVEAPKPVTRQEHKAAIGDAENRLLKAYMEDDHEAHDAIKKEIQDLHDNMPKVEFKDKDRPTHEEFLDYTWGAKTVGEVYDWMLKDGVGYEHYRYLIEHLNQFEGIRNTGFEMTPEQLTYVKDGKTRNAIGLAYGGNKYSPEARAGKQNLIQVGKGGSVITFLHESIHAGTSDFMKAFPNHPAVVKLKNLYEEVKAKDLEKFSEQITADVNSGKITPKEAQQKYDAYQKGEDGSGRDYGFTNADEFASESHSNHMFQKKLSGMEVEGPKPGKPISALDKFKGIIADMFKINRKARSALDDIIDATNEVMKGQEEHFQADKAMHESEKAKYDEARKRSEEENRGPYPSESDSSGSEKVDEVLKDKVDVRTIPDKKTFLELATDIFEKHGEDAAIEFFEAYSKEVKERQIPVPENNKDLDKSFHTLDGFSVRDKSEQIMGYKKSTEMGITDEDRKIAFDILELGPSKGGKVPGKLGKILDDIAAEKLALVKKAKAMGLKVGEEFTSGQNRIRLYGVKDKQGKIWQEFFANKTPMGDKIAEQANAAHERKVFAIKGQEGRIVEIHRVPEDHTMKYIDDQGQPRTREVKKGTQIWEWTKDKDGTGTSKKLIAHSDELDFNKESIVDTLDGKENIQLEDAKVHHIEKQSPYRYLHDAEASARLSLMGLRKYVREAEFFKNLTESKMFDIVGHSPDKPLETLPKGWKVPDNIDRIPQLRGWHFDPKTAAIISDFAKVWDNNMMLKLSNQIVKAIMLNPLPHMMNEFMHIWNARGLTGWVSPSGLSSLAKTGAQAWKDVMQQTPYYRELMTEGGSILGATPRNVLFDRIIEAASKEMMGDKGLNRSVGSLAKKLGTSAADLYNGISRKSQQAMWVARDVMYVQYVREIQNFHLKRTGEELSIGDAAERAGRHMPTYRMPSEILGSRTVAKLMKNPNVTTFSSYHYGVLNSLINTVKDVDPRLLKTKEGRAQFRDGVDSMLAIGVALAVLYPAADKISEMVFGEGATQRRAGPYHVIEGVTKAMEGEKDLTALIWPLFTFNPAAALLGQVLINKKMFTGKEVYHPDDDFGEKLQDVGNFVIKQMPQGPGLMSAAQDSDEGKSFLAKQLDIKAPTPKTQSIIERAKKRQEIAHKSREKARQHGKYNQ
jgi:hypothetical protein